MENKNEQKLKEDQERLIKIALDLYKNHKSANNFIEEIEDYTKFDIFEILSPTDDAFYRLLNTIFDTEEMKVLFHQDMKEHERTSYFFVACALLQKIYDDIKQESFAEIQILKRLFQFSKKTRSASEMNLDEYGPAGFSKITYK